MIAFLTRRILLAGLSVFAITVITYVIVQMPPGDYVDSYIQLVITGNNTNLTMEDTELIAASLRTRWGLDKPLPVQYLKWMSNVVRGEFGTSLIHRVPVKEVMGERVLMTVVLAVSTIMFTWMMAIPIGIYSAVRQRSVGDYTFTLYLGLGV